MKFRIVAALLAPLLAGATQSSFGATALVQPAMAAGYVVAPLADAAPAAEATSGNDSDVAGRSQNAPGPGFAGPGPGWG